PCSRSLFYYRARAAALHSSPTRRSSDLAVGAGLAPGVGDLDARHRTGGLDGAGDRGEGFGLGVVPQPGAGRGDAPLGGDGGGLRSEEHTSELQSREKLVCRLLLDKKNTG